MTLDRFFLLQEQFHNFLYNLRYLYKGEVSASFSYSYKLDELYIHIGKVFDVDLTDKRRKFDFYIKVYMLPDK